MVTAPRRTGRAGPSPGAGPPPSPEAFAGDVVDRLRAAFEPAADPVRAAGAAAYLRHQFPFLGLPAPVRRRLAAEALRGLARPSEQELAAAALALWAEPERELQHAACDYVRANIGVAGPSFIEVVRHLVTTKSWWDTVDTLAAHAAGPLVRRHPELAEHLDRWAGDGDFWLARTAILHQLTYGPATDAGRLFGYCRLRAGDRELFVRKAIGWALRQYAAVSPAAVEAFVAATPALSRLSVTEAMKGVRRARRGAAVPPEPSR